MNATTQAKRNARPKPEQIKVGNVIVKIYKRDRETATGKRTVFEIPDYTSGARRLRGFTDHGTARKEAEKIARQLSTGDATAARMSNADAASFGRSKELIRPTGTSLEVVAATYAKIFEIVGDAGIEAAQFYKRHRPDQVTRKCVADVIVELIVTKEARGKSACYIADLRSRLKRFAKFFGADTSIITQPDLKVEPDTRNRGVDISSIVTSDVQKWLDGLKLAPQSAKNFRTVISTLFSFAESRGYIFKGGNPVESTEEITANGGDIQIFTPDEIARLLAAASREFLPVIALGAFAGLRTAEIERLEWSDIHFAEKFIVIGASKSKTASRRIVPLSDNLAAWLAPYTKQTGLIWKRTELWRARAETVKAAGVKWKPNGLRHSAASYWFAGCNDAGRVAGYLGNSAAVIHKHYRELVRPADAVKWFSILPESAVNVLPLAAASVAKILNLPTAKAAP